MVQIEGAENRVPFERKKYNDSVYELNTFCQSLFGGWVSNSRNIKVREPFKATEEHKQIPKVNGTTQFE